MKKTLLILLFLTLSLPCHAQIDEDLIIEAQSDDDTLTDYQLKKVQNRVNYNKRINYNIAKRSPRELKDLIDNDQKINARLYRREGLEAPQKITIDPNDPEQVKLYLKYRVPDVDKLIREETFFDN